MTNPTGRVISALADRYRIERELGAGGMATVYVAHDLRNDRQVALKVLHAEFAASLGTARFLAEIRATAAWQHPNILPLFDSGEIDGALYYVMPFVNAETLKVRLAREHQLPVQEAVSMARDVASALDYAHRAGLVHRDIKPANIYLTEAGAVVADFGIARAVVQPETHSLTLAGKVIGTPAYFSPEQVTGQIPDGRSDLYNLGCVLYECLAGEVPFPGRALAMIAQRLTGSPPSVRAKRGEVSVQLDAVVRKAMATDPSSRFDTGQAFIKALVATDTA